MSLVIDTSAIVKWFVKEAGHGEALNLLDTDEQMICPDFALVEAANVIWRKQRSGQVSQEQAEESIRKIPTFFDAVVPASDLLEDAYGLAQALSHSVYDCVFLAAALQEPDRALISADDAFLGKAAASGYGDAIKALSGTSLDVDVVIDLASALMQRHDYFRQVLHTVRDKVEGAAKAVFSGLAVYPVSDLRPAMDSPAYRHVRTELLRLSVADVQLILAICWYGRRYGSQGFARDLENARHTLRDVEANAPYIISNLQHFEAGVKRLSQDNIDTQQ